MATSPPPGATVDVFIVTPMPTGPILRRLTLRGPPSAFEA
jgi:hypothetical protein